VSRKATTQPTSIVCVGIAARTVKRSSVTRIASPAAITHQARAGRQPLRANAKTIVVTIAASPASEVAGTRTPVPSKAVVTKLVSIAAAARPAITPSRASAARQRTRAWLATRQTSPAWAKT
jgi:hypothetical protein